MNIRPFEIKDEPAVVRLWTDCDLLRPWNDPEKDIACKMKIQPDLFLVGCVQDQIMASVMAGFDGHRGWIYYLAVHPDYQKKGYGRKILAAIEKKLKKAGCPKINLQVRTSNKNKVEFYRHLGFKPDDVVSLGKRID